MGKLVSKERKNKEIRDKGFNKNESRLVEDDRKGNEIDVVDDEGETKENFGVDNDDKIRIDDVEINSQYENVEELKMSKGNYVKLEPIYGVVKKRGKDVKEDLKSDLSVGSRNQTEITADEIIEHDARMREEIMHLEEESVGCETLKKGEIAKDHLSSETDIEADILKNLEDILKYITEITGTLGKVDVGTETDIKQKKRSKRSEKLKWKIKSDGCPVIDGDDFTNNGISSGCDKMKNGSVFTRTENVLALTSKNTKRNDSVRQSVIDELTAESTTNALKNNCKLQGETDKQDKREYENTWSVLEKFLIEFNEYYKPIGYEKLEFGSVTNKMELNGRDEEKPLGPLAVFSFLEVGVEPCQVTSTTPTGHYLLATGTILQTKEHGVNFPLVHMKEDDGTFTGYLNNGHKLDNSIIQQGLYREVRSICPEEELKDIKEEVANNVAYILLGFKSLDTNFSQVMVDSWKDWTGARYIYMYLPDELGLTRIRFYRREVPNGTSTIFTYLVVVECRNVNSSDKQMKLLEFARRLRVQKMNSYISVYGISNKT